MTNELDSVLREIAAELTRARAKFPGDNVTTLAMAEEAGELCTAAFDEPRAAVRKEAVQTAVMAIRLILDGDATLRVWRAVQGLDPLVEGEKLTGAELIAVERHRQIHSEKWTAERDAGYTRGELALAAVTYALEGYRNNNLRDDGLPVTWPWGPEWWKPTNHRRNLIKAGALIAAELDRISEPN